MSRAHDFRRRADAPDPRALDGDALYRLRDRALDDLAARIHLAATHHTDTDAELELELAQ